MLLCKALAHLSRNTGGSADLLVVTAAVLGDDGKNSVLYKGLEEYIVIVLAKTCIRWKKKDFWESNTSR